MRPDPRRIAARLHRSVLPDRADRFLVRQSGLFDQTWVETQLDRTFPTLDHAIDAYLASPDCSPHPLFLPEWIDKRFGRPSSSEVDGLVWYLRNGRARNWASTHPLVDPHTIYAEHPEFRDAPHGPLAAWLRHHGPTEPLPTTQARPALSPAAIAATSTLAARDWTAQAAHRFAPRTSPDPPLEPELPTGPPLSGSEGAPLVSVVMPLWNRATVVRRAIESVQAQSHQDWELLVVDDGSTDESLAVARGIAHFDPRVVVLAEPHRGVSAARNSALERARGRYVAFLDTDNTWRPDFLGMMLHTLESHGWEMAHAAMRSRRDGEVYYRAFEGTYRNLLVANHVDLNVLVARTTVVREIGGFDETLRRGVDYDLVLRLSERWALHLVPYIGVDYLDDEVGTTRISTTESSAWLSVIASRHLIDWTAEAARERVAGLTSVVVPSLGSVRESMRWMRELSGHDDVELVVVGSALPRWQHVALSVLAEAFGNVRLAVLQANRGVPTALNVGCAASAGDRIVLVIGQVKPDATPIRRLARLLDDDSVALTQPLTVDATGVVVSAGAVFGPDTARPEPFLHGHPVEDARRVGRADLPGALGPVVAVRADTLAALRGLDPLLDDHLSETDLSLRIQERELGRIMLEPDAVVASERDVLPEPAEHAAALRLFDERFTRPPEGSARVWAAAGFDIVAHRNRPVEAAVPQPTDHPVLAPRTLVQPSRIEVVEGRPHLRWTIDLASPGGPDGLIWGDTYYGEALAEALRRHGQSVSVDSRDARHRASRDLDDVVLVLRGLDQVAPRPGRLNIEWIISHPDLVAPAEMAAFDLVYAASPMWAETVSREWDLQVHPLLQATDPMRFNVGRGDFDTGPDVLFVGNSRGILRPSLRHAMAAGAEVTVHGTGWREFLPPAAVTSKLVPNADLGALYTSAGVVLNDHWEDMRQAGFVSNRLMDAAASGARIVSDEIPCVDLTAMFHGLVQTFADEADMRRILASRAELFPDAAARIQIAAQVAAEHSFDQRAQTLLEDAVRAIARRSDQRSR